MAWQSYVDSLCSGCGNPRHESMGKGAEYHASALRCHSCEAIAKRSKGFPEDARDGLYFAADLPRTARKPE